jgi:hypothetical protein
MRRPDRPRQLHHLLALCPLRTACSATTHANAAAKYAKATTALAAAAAADPCHPVPPPMTIPRCCCRLLLQLYVRGPGDAEAAVLCAEQAGEGLPRVALGVREQHARWGEAVAPAPLRRHGAVAAEPEQQPEQPPQRRRLPRVPPRRVSAAAAAAAAAAVGGAHLRAQLGASVAFIVARAPGGQFPGPMWR